MRKRLLWGLLGALWATCALAWPRVDAQLNAAARAGDIAAIDEALAAGANPDQARALAAAIAAGHREAVDDLLAHHADPNAWALGHDYALSGPEGSPVFAAAKLGGRATLLDLVRHGADLNAASRVGYLGDTPLAFAARNGEVGAVRLLLEAGADVNHRSGSGTTALRDALSAGPHAVEIVQLLLAHGADPDIRDNQGKSAREISYWYGSPEIRFAIERARPPAPFTRPEDMASIHQVLLCRAADAAMIPNYQASTSGAYERWQAPRATVIAQIESTSEFHSSMTRLLGEITPQGLHGQASAEPTKAVEIESQCDLVLPPELMPAHPTQAAEVERVRMALVCKAAYDVLIPGYEVRTEKAYAHWRESHRAALAQIESAPEFREERAEALREVGDNPTTVRGVCARFMPADLLAAAEQSPSSGSGAPSGFAVPPGSFGSGSNPAASNSAAAGPPPEVPAPVAEVAPAPKRFVNQASVKVKVKNVIQTAPNPVGGGVSPQQPQ